MDFYIVTIIILPLIGFAINGIFGKKINNEKISGIIGTSTVGIGFIISVSLLFNMISLPVEKGVLWCMLQIGFQQGNSM